MKPRDLSDVGYWTLKWWRDLAEVREDWADCDADHDLQWLAEVNAEIARRCGAAPEPATTQ